MEDEAIYKFTLPYPWKKTLHGIYWITIGAYLLIIILAYNSFIFRENPPDYGWFLFSLFSIGGIALGLALIMRYILIHGDKIKAPIEVIVKESSIEWKKGPRKAEFALSPIRDITFIVTDKKVKIDANYREKVGNLRGWMMQFRVHSEINDYEDYKKFLKEIYPEFRKVLERRIRELNPDVKVITRDERKKYR